MLDELGFDVATSEVECCGMAGSFGYKSEYYDLSMDVGSELEGAFDDPGRQLVASGTSCTEQLGAVFDAGVVHPIELVAPERS